MSNTLKFGNGQWATKVGSTLAYNDENGNFKPLPFDFTRASSATVVNKDGLIEIVGSGEPRIDFLNDSNGALLLEPSRSNAITNSEEFGSTGWSFVTTGSAIAPIVIDNYAISPDGTQNAQRIQFHLGGGTTSSDRTIIRQSVGLQSDWFFSVWIKSTNGQEQKILWHVGGDENETTITEEWQRYTFSKNGTPTAFLGLSLRGATSTVDTADILVYGFQAEQGSYATSYIPTQGAISTRVADACNDAGNDQVINSTEGVLYAEISALANDITQRAISLSDGTNTNRVTLLYNDASNAIRLFLQVGGATQASIITTAYTITDFHKIAVRWALNDFSLWVDGVEAGTDNLGIIFPSNTLSTLDFNFPISGAAFYGKTKDLRVYNTALTDQELINLTTI